MKICFFVLLLLLSTTVWTQISITKEYVRLTPPEEKEKINFGCSLTIQEDELFVGAFNNENGNKVFIYSLDGIKATLKQTIEKPQGVSFFGYLVAVSEDKMVVVASSSKKMFLYKKTNGVWCENPKDEKDLVGIPNGLSMNGNTIVVSSSSNNAVIYTLSDDAKFGEALLELENTSPSVGCLVKGNLLFVAQKSNGVMIYELKEGMWTLKSSLLDEKIGSSNATYFAYDGGELIWGNYEKEKQCVYVAKQEENEWIITDTISKPDDYEGSTWGKTVVCKDGKMVVSGNYSINNPMPAYYYEKENETWALKKKLDAENVIGNSATFNGRVYAVSNQNQNINDEEIHMGVVYLFDLLSLTGIKNVENERLNDVEIYDLRGRKVDNPRSGLYIRNGKLILLK